MGRGGTLELGDLLIREGLISKACLSEALAAQAKTRHDVLPIRRDGQSLTVATADPLDVWAMDPVRRLAANARLGVEVLLAPAEALVQARESCYARLEHREIRA